MVSEFKAHLHNFCTSYLNTSGSILAWRKPNRLWLAKIEIEDCPQFSIGVRHRNLKGKF
jgi:hypothetical protein